MKRVLSLLLSLVLVLGLWSPAPAKAAGSKLIAITFDDGPGPYTARLLDGLKARGVKATFFMVGSNVSRYPALVERAYQEGHQIANHSYDHSELTALSDSAVKSQISRTNTLLDKACGAGTSYMVRAPYGSTNARVRAAIGAPLVFWSVDPEDWKYRNAATVKNKVVNGASDGAIILLHDIHSTSVDGALAAIDILKKQGYEFVTVQELFRRRGAALQNGVSYSKCAPTGKDLGAITAPAFSSAPAEGGKLKITLTAQPGAAIYYSLGSGNFNQSSTKYTGPITVSPPCTIRAVAAFNMNGSRSAVSQKSFSRYAAAAPIIHITDGKMTLKSQSAGAALYYTLNGTTATEKSTKYTGPVTLKPGTVVSACAGGGLYLTGPASRATYSARGNFFRDVFPNNWYYEIVDEAAAEGLMLGMGDGVFAPDAPVTRAQFITMLYRTAGEAVTREEREACPFRDLKAGSYYIDPIAWGYAKGIVQGVGQQKFAPDDPVTRQEMSKMLVEYLLYRQKDLPEGTALTYKDAGTIDGWAVEYAEKAAACGLMLGDEKGNFSPKAGGTRAQSATVFLRLADVEQALPDTPTEEIQ